MFLVTAYTTDCAPTRRAECETHEEALEQAQVDLDWVRDRAFGALDASQIEGTESEYDAFAEQIALISDIEIGSEVELGPLPDGYNIKIEHIAEAA